MKIVCLSLLVLSAGLVEATPKAVDSASVLFEFAADTPLVVIPVLVNGRGPYKFLLDTGASHSILSGALAARLDLQIARQKNLITANGPLPGTTGTINTIQVGDICIVRPQIVVADFALLNILHLDGILGGDQLRSFNLFIDYSRQTVRIDRRSKTVVTSSLADDQN